MKLKDKVAIVTGASRGLGRAAALALAQEGCSVAVNYLSSEDAAQEVVRQIRALPGKAIAVRADVSKADQVNEMVRRTLEEFGRIDILVNNAGILKGASLLELTEEMWDEVLDINLKGTFLCSKAVAEVMVNQRRGKIINLSSVAGFLAVPDYPHYAVSKAGVLGFTRSIAEDLGPFNIQVNAIAPGWIDTDMNAPAKGTPDEQKVCDQTPLRRWGTPEEVADLVLFLATNADFITGQAIIIDGGLHNTYFKL